MEPLANVHGVIQPLAEVKISAMDRGFLFGDAVYEVLRIYAGQPWLEDEHFQRFEHSLAAIRIHGVDLQRVRRRMHETIAAGDFREAIAYIQITRGSAPRSHPFPVNATPLEFLFIQEFKDPYQESRKVGVSAILQPDIRWDRCDIKSTNLLGNVLAMQAAKEASCPEAILSLPDGTLTEGTHSSFFGVLDGKLRTSPKGNPILPGITRDLALRLASKADVPYVEQSLNKEDLARVTELFLTGTTAEVLPIVRVDGRQIGNGSVGPITSRLQEMYSAAVREFVAGEV